MTHPFEKANLGQAPFTLVGIFESTRNVNAGSLLAEAIHVATGTCEYCLRSIKHCHEIQDANGKKFTVGSSCCRKVDRTLEKDYFRSLNKEQSKERLTKFREENAEIILAFNKIYGTLEFDAKLHSLPHPFPAHSDKTMLDYINYVGIKDDFDKVRRIQADDLLSFGETTKNELSTYKKHVAKIEKAKKDYKDFLENSQFVGELGKRQEFIATIVDSFSFQNNWGTYTTLTTLRDENNNCLKYWNSIKYDVKVNSKGRKWTDTLDHTEGDKVTFKATVKEHSFSKRDDETYGQKQTVLSRASKAKPV